MNNTIANSDDINSNGKIALVCAGCGKEFFVDSCVDKKSFCSLECEENSKYGYIVIKKDGTVDVIECQCCANIIEECKQSGVIDEFMTFCDSSLVDKSAIYLGVISGKVEYGKFIDKSNINSYSSKVFNMPLVGNVVIADSICMNPIPLYLANRIVKKMDALVEENAQYTIPDRFPEMDCSDEDNYSE